MRYLALIYGDESTVLPDEEQQAVMQEYYEYTDAVSKAGVMQTAEALEPTSTATTVRLRNDETLTIDGPFAETKEQLAGFYLFDCENLDQAVEWAARIPGAKHGSIELRPIMEIPDAPES